MQNAFEIPLTPEPQRLSIRLAGTDYRLTVRYFEPPASVGQPGGWVLDIAPDTDAATPHIAGLPLVTGTNLLAQLGYIGLAGELYVYTDGDAGAVPTLQNLGTASKLFFVTSQGAV